MSTREWQIEALRFTFIGLSDEAAEHLGRMQNLVGIIPETVTERPQQLTRTEEAPWGQGKLNLVTQPRRLDVIYNAISSDPILLPNGGQFPEAGYELLDLVKKISGTAAGRVACGGVILHKTATAKDGYAALGELLPFMAFQEDMREFAMQINRPKEIEGLTCNELSKWSVASINLFQVNSSSGETIFTNNGETAVRFEFDFNTADTSPIPEEKDIYHILRALFDRCLAVSQDGAQ